MCPAPPLQAAYASATVQTKVSILAVSAFSAACKFDPLTLAPGRFGTEIE